jgi:hypothetical protein
MIIPNLQKELTMKSALYNATLINNSFPRVQNYDLPTSQMNASMLKSAIWLGVHSGDFDVKFIRDKHYLITPWMMVALPEQPETNDGLVVHLSGYQIEHMSTIEELVEYLQSWSNQFEKCGPFEVKLYGGDDKEVTDLRRELNCAFINTMADLKLNAEGQ